MEVHEETFRSVVVTNRHLRVVLSKGFYPPWL